MNKILIKTAMAAALFCLTILPTGKASAFVVTCVNCSNSWTQAMERVTSVAQLVSLLQSYQEAVMQTQQQIQMVQNTLKQYELMLKNAAKLPSSLLNEMQSKFNELAQLTTQLNTQKGDYLAMGQVFKEVYPEAGILEGIAQSAGTENVSEIWDKWSGEVDRAAQATFQLTGSQLNDLAHDSAALERHISSLLNTPTGQMQAIEAGNSLAALQVNELRQLRALMATSIQSATGAMMKEEKRNQLSEKQREFLLDTSDLPSQYQGYK